MDEPPGSAVDQRKGGRDDRVIRRAEADFLGKRDPKHHPRLRIVGKPIARGTVDEGIEVGHPAKNLPDNGYGETMVIGWKCALSLGCGIESPPATKHGVEHLQGC